MSRAAELEHEIAVIDEELADLTWLIVASNNRIQSLKAKKGIRHSELFQALLEESPVHPTIKPSFTLCNCREHAGDSDSCPIHNREATFQSADLS